MQPKADAAPEPVYGSEHPRIAPPLPLHSDLGTFLRVVRRMKLDPYPWQLVAMRYANARTENVWQYPQVCVVVGRQNGKTTLLVPHIVARLEMGRRIIHASQLREFTRDVFRRVASVVEGRKGVKVRWTVGQESISMGQGFYRIVATTPGGARGATADDLIVDELRELADNRFITAAEPTLTASRDPQTLYLSNAGDDESVVLNAVRARAGHDPMLAYLEWSASPDLSSEDRAGWRAANPALGHAPGMLRFLEQQYVSRQLSGELAAFETEHLCRWVPTMRQRLVDDFAWMQCRDDALPARGARNFMGVSMSPDGRRASAVIAWKHDAGIALRGAWEVWGEPVIDSDRFGADLRQWAVQHGVARAGYDPLTDMAVAKMLPRAEAINGRQFANATSRFVAGVSGGTLRWTDADAVTDDLRYTARKFGDGGVYEAVRANDDRPITASLAAIRAFWLASGIAKPRPQIR